MSQGEKHKRQMEENAAAKGNKMRRLTEETFQSTFVATSELHLKGKALCASVTEGISLMAVGKADSSVKIVQLRLHVNGAHAAWTRGETITLIGHKNPAYIGSFSSDGARLVTCSEDFNIRLWNVLSASCVSYSQSCSYIRGIAFDSHASSFATVEDIGYASLWKADGHKMICMKQVYQEPILTVCIFHPNQKYVVSGSASSKVRVWDTSKEGYSMELIELLHNHWITALAFSFCCNFMVAGANDGLVFVWNWLIKAVVHRLDLHTATITSIGFAWDNKHIAVGSEDTRVSIWQFDPASDEDLLVGHRASDGGSVLQVRFVSQSHLVAICVDKFRVNVVAAEGGG